MLPEKAWTSSLCMTVGTTKDEGQVMAGLVVHQSRYYYSCMNIWTSHWHVKSIAMLKGKSWPHVNWWILYGDSQEVVRRCQSLKVSLVGGTVELCSVFIQFVVFCAPLCLVYLCVCLVCALCVPCVPCVPCVCLVCLVCALWFFFQS